MKDKERTTILRSKERKKKKRKRDDNLDESSLDFKFSILKRDWLKGS
jgi:hypothetical protein